VILFHKYFGAAIGSFDDIAALGKDDGVVVAIHVVAVNDGA
jgi:hypothetical protein